ncbi:trans-sialidase, putative, partial [Trypanosoma cruzi marinkellei]
MSRRVFTSAVLLLLLVMMCCGSGGAAQDARQSSGPTFEWQDITDDKESVDSLAVPGLLNVGSDVFAVAEAQFEKEDTVLTGIASQLLTIKTDNERTEVLEDAKKDTKVLEEVTSTVEKKRVDVSRPTAVVNGSDIYMLAGNYSRKGDQESVTDDWGLLLVKGNVINEATNKKIHWIDTKCLPPSLLDTKPESWTGVIGGGGLGIKMNDGTLVFPVEGTTTGDTQKGKKTVLLIIYSSKEDKSWKLSKEISAD